MKTRKVGEPVVCLSVREVAERLGIGGNAVYRLIASGELPHVRIGRRTIRVRGCDLSEFLLRRRRLGEQEAAEGVEPAIGENAP